MQDVPNEILQRAYQRRPLYLVKLPFLWGLVFLFGWAGTWAAHHTRFGFPACLAAGFCIGMLVRGLGSIGHDAVHGCVSKNRFVTYVLGAWAWSATMMSFTLYRAYHLDHHKIVNMPHDVDRVQVSRFTKNPTLAVILRLAIYTFLYPLYWASQVTRYAAQLSFGLKLRMVLELLAIFGTALAFYPLMGPMAWFTIVATQAITGAFFASTTSMAEHYGIEFDADHAYSSRTYATASPFLDFVWSGTPYHNEHHKYPGIPYYNLRRFHLESLPYYSERVRANIHLNFWGLILGLWKRAARPDLDVERERARRDAESLQLQAA